MVARRVSTPELDAILRNRAASAEAAKRGRAHRALPLDEVERSEREKRVAWTDQRAAAILHQRFPHCTGSCEQGRSQCDCPTAGASCVSNIEDEAPYNLRPSLIRRQSLAERVLLSRPPTYTVAAVMALALLCAWQWVRS